MTITRGDKERFEATISNFSGNLSASTTKIQFTVKYSPGDDDASAVALLTKDSGRIVVDNPTTLSWYVTAADYTITKLAKALRLFWDLQIIDQTESPQGVYTVASGNLTMKPDESLAVA